MAAAHTAANSKRRTGSSSRASAGGPGGRETAAEPEPSWLPKGLVHMASALTEIYGRLEHLHTRDILLSLVVLLRATQQQQKQPTGGVSSTTADAVAATASASSAVQSALVGPDAAEEDDAAATRLVVRTSDEGRPVTVLPPGMTAATDPIAIADALRLLKWAAASYAADDAELERMLPLGARLSSHIPQRSYASNPRTLLPAYLIGIDHSMKAVVVSIRGTWTWTDAVVNLTMSWEPWSGGTAHRGMLLTSKATIDHIALSADLPSLMRAHPGYRLITCGHSMGGGVAALCANMLRLQFPRVSCHVFASPSCVSKDVAMSMRPYVTSWINGDDLVARFHVDSSERLRKKLSRLALADELVALLALDNVIAGGPRAAAIARALASASSSLASGASALGGWSATLLRDAPLAAVTRLGLTDTSVLRKLVGLVQDSTEGTPPAAQGGPAPVGAAADAGGSGTGSIVRAASAAPSPGNSSAISDALNSIAAAVPSTVPAPSASGPTPDTNAAAASDVTSVLRYLSRLIGRDTRTSDSRGAASQSAMVAAAALGSVPGFSMPQGSPAREQPSTLTDSFILLPESGDVLPGANSDSGYSTNGLAAAASGCTPVESTLASPMNENKKDNEPRGQAKTTTKATDNNEQNGFRVNSNNGSKSASPSAASAAAVSALTEITGTYVLTPLKSLASHLPVPWSASQRPSPSHSARGGGGNGGSDGGNDASSIDELAAAIFLADEMGRVQQPSADARSQALRQSQSALPSALAQREWVRGLQFYPPGEVLHLAYPAGFVRQDRYRMVPAEREFEADRALRQAAGAARAAGVNHDDDEEAGPGAAARRQAWLLDGYVGPVLIHVPPERPTKMPLPLQPLMAPHSVAAAVAPLVNGTLPSVVSPNQLADSPSSAATTTPAASGAATPSVQPGIIPEALMDRGRYFSHMHITPHAFSDHLIAALEHELVAYALHLSRRLLDRAHRASSRRDQEEVWGEDRGGRIGA